MDFRTSPLLAFAIILPALVLAKIQYLDDGDTSSWTFTGSTLTPLTWGAVTIAYPCAGCFSHGANNEKPDPNKAYGGTYHDGTSSLGGTIKFRGNAIVVYGIQTAASASINFSIGGLQYTYPGTNTSAPLLYNTVLLNATGLDESSELTVHFTINLSVGGNWALFDYAAVTVMDETSTAGSSLSPSTSPLSVSKKQPIGAIVGGALGGIALVLLFGLAFLFMKWPRVQNYLNKPHGQAELVSPYPLDLSFTTDSPTTSPVNTLATYLREKRNSPTSHRASTGEEPMTQRCPPSHANETSKLKGGSSDGPDGKRDYAITDDIQIFLRHITTGEVKAPDSNLIVGNGELRVSDIGINVL
ncbi:hypothetical protein DL96DRAFT_1678414 [Flagelloscypha sp. PMI_526]|nr:hypothetical protein DL96DRAFT_1678414 [Flagelloscypha sp. PMI_526]